MADHHTTMSGEEPRHHQVAISMSSTPSDRSLAVGAGAGAGVGIAGASAASTPRSSKLVPLDSLQKLMLKSPAADAEGGDGGGEQQRARVVVPVAEVPLAKKAAAEFVGTFILIFAVVSTIVADAQHGGVEGLVGVAASAGLAVVAVVLAVVHVSGSHLNPAVSLAMAVLGHLPPGHVLPYAAAQTAGATAATFLARAMYRPADLAVMATLPRVGAAEAFFLELVLTFVLMFVITAVATDPTSSKELVAMAIAAAIMMNALIGGPSTGPSMNPARTIGAALATGKYKDIWVYLLAPPLGAIAGGATYTFIKP